MRVTHLTRCVSDHCPVLLETNPSNSVFLPRAFKFQSFWLSDVSFMGIVIEAWGWTSPLRESIEKPRFGTRIILVIFLGKRKGSRLVLTASKRP